MAELNSKLHCKKDGVTEEIVAYTTLEEVQNQGIPVKIDGFDAYIKYGSIADVNSSQLNCKINNEGYSVHKTAIPADEVLLACFDVSTNAQISSVYFPIPDNGVLYLNNENAPSVGGYDFVQLEGIKRTDIDTKIFNVWYVGNDVYDNTREDWDSDFMNSGGMTKMHVINTYSAKRMTWLFAGSSSLTTVPRINTSNVEEMHYMFRDCSSLTTVPEMDTSKVTSMMMLFENCKSLITAPKLETSNVTNMYGMFMGCSSLTTVPEMDTSKVTSMGGMFYGCSSLTTVPEMDTSKVTEFFNMFKKCSKLTSVPWEIDMSNATSCAGMFEECPVENVKLKNVPRSLEFTYIGTTNYTVLNYI